jgi:hypothetical protein
VGFIWRMVLRIKGEKGKGRNGEGGNLEH